MLCLCMQSGDVMTPITNYSSTAMADEQYNPGPEYLSNTGYSSRGETSVIMKPLLRKLRMESSCYWSNPNIGITCSSTYALPSLVKRESGREVYLVNCINTVCLSADTHI